MKAANTVTNVTTTASGGQRTNVDVEQQQEVLNRGIIPINKAIEEQNQKLAELTEKRTKLNEQLETSKTRYNGLQQTISQLNVTQSELTSAVARYDEIQRIAKDLAEGRINMSTKEVNNLIIEKREIEALIKSIDQAATAKAKYGAQIQQTSIELDKCNAQIAETEVSIGKLEKALKKQKIASTFKSILSTVG